MFQLAVDILAVGKPPLQTKKFDLQTHATRHRLRNIAGSSFSVQPNGCSAKSPTERKPVTMPGSDCQILQSLCVRESETRWRTLRIDDVLPESPFDFPITLARQKLTSSPRLKKRCERMSKQVCGHPPPPAVVFTARRAPPIDEGKPLRPMCLPQAPKGQIACP